ncbi:PREDICTED: protein MTL1-like [Poecilia mexicana]|uniref:protein MTL1-like n=1 Tax=Poecilia mexicana TaxID=48701 RepID=UPI00072E88D3|nr:PREDICTED: protein MTL1-like [Poecilia mexicana]
MAAGKPRIIVLRMTFLTLPVFTVEITANGQQALSISCSASAAEVSSLEEASLPSTESLLLLTVSSSSASVASILCSSFSLSSFSSFVSSTESDPCLLVVSSTSPLPDSSSVVSASISSSSWSSSASLARPRPCIRFTLPESSLQSTTSSSSASSNLCTLVHSAVAPSPVCSSFFDFIDISDTHDWMDLADMLLGGLSSPCLRLSSLLIGVPSSSPLVECIDLFDLVETIESTDSGVTDPHSFSPSTTLSSGQTTSKQPASTFDRLETVEMFDFVDFSDLPDMLLAALSTISPLLVMFL